MDKTAHMLFCITVKFQNSGQREDSVILFRDIKKKKVEESQLSNSL